MSCYQSKDVTGACDACGAPADMMHLPARPFGIYCEKHCPICAMASLAALAAIHKADRQRPTAAFHSPKSRSRTAQSI